MSEEDDRSEARDADSEDTKTALAELAELVKARQSESSGSDASETDGSDEETPFEWVGEEATAQADDRLEDIKRELRDTANTSPDGLKREFPSLSQKSLGDLLAEIDTDIEESLVEVEDASNVLLLDASGGSQCDVYCTELLTRTPPTQSNVLFVTLTESVDERLAVWQNHVDTLPAEMTIVTAADQTRSTQAASVISPGNQSGTISVKTLDDPADLPRLGIVLNRIVKEWDASPNHAYVCFHSLTELLQYVDSKRLFRFLHLLRNRLGSVDSTVHYHMNTAAHDDQTIAIFQSLFDAVLRIDADGGVEVVSKPP